MGRGKKHELDPDTPIFTRGVDRISPGVFVNTSYLHVAPSKGQWGEQGYIRSVDETSEGHLRFRCYNADHEGDVEVTLGSAVDQSAVRVEKPDGWKMLGTPLRVSVHEDIEEPYEARHESFREFDEGRFESVVAVAAIGWNDKILEWYEWSQKNA